jgi:hypothetical protein
MKSCFREKDRETHIITAEAQEQKYPWDPGLVGQSIVPDTQETEARRSFEPDQHSRTPITKKTK